MMLHTPLGIKRACQPMLANTSQCIQMGQCGRVAMLQQSVAGTLPTLAHPLVCECLHGHVVLALTHVIPRASMLPGHACWGCIKACTWASMIFSVWSPRLLHLSYCASLSPMQQQREQEQEEQLDRVRCGHHSWTAITCTPHAYSMPHGGT